MYANVINFHIFSGQSLFHLGRYEEAESNFHQSLTCKADHVPTHLTYARLLSQVNRFEESERFYKKALELDRNNLPTYLHYGKNMLTGEEL